MQLDPLPTTDQITNASERPILAALDTLLELMVRTLLAEHPTLDIQTDASRDGEPEQPRAALAASAIIMARSLRDIVNAYGSILDRLYKDQPSGDDLF